MIGWILLIGIVLVIILLIGMYNGLVRLKVQVDNAWETFNGAEPVAVMARLPPEPEHDGEDEDGKEERPASLARWSPAVFTSIGKAQP